MTRLRIPHFRHPWRAAEKLLLRFPHFRHPWRAHESVSVFPLVGSGAGPVERRGLGFENVKLYANSMNEYLADPGRR